MEMLMSKWSTWCNFAYWRAKQRLDTETLSFPTMGFKQL